MLRNLIITIACLCVIIMTGCDAPDESTGSQPAVSTDTAPVGTRTITRTVVVTQYVTVAEAAKETTTKVQPEKEKKTKKNTSFEFTTNIIAFVDGEPVYADEFHAVFSSDKLDRLPHYLRDEFNKGREELIERLIHNKIVARAADDEDFSNNPEYVKERDAAIRQLKMQYYYDEHVASRVKVLPQEINEYYTMNKSDYVAPERIRARHILIQVKPYAHPAEVTNAFQKAHRLRRRLLEGENFAEIAREESDCPSAKQDGDLGYFSRGQMVPAFENTAFALRRNEISDVIKTEFGYHIIQLRDRIPARERSLDEVRQEIQQQLEQEKEEALYAEYYKQLTNKYKVICNESLIRSLLHSL